MVSFRLSCYCKDDDLLKFTIVLATNNFMIFNAKMRNRKKFNIILYISMLKVLEGDCMTRYLSNNIPHSGQIGGPKKVRLRHIELAISNAFVEWLRCLPYF
jgi:hypothetical protein